MSGVVRKKQQIGKDKNQLGGENPDIWVPPEYESDLDSGNAAALL